VVVVPTAISHVVLLLYCKDTVPPDTTSLSQLENTRLRFILQRSCTCCNVVAACVSMPQPWRVTHNSYFPPCSHASVGARVFDVNIEGSPRNDIDIVRLGGNQAYKAVTVTFYPVIVNDGFLTINFMDNVPLVSVWLLLQRAVFCRLTVFSLCRLIFQRSRALRSTRRSKQLASKPETKLVMGM
jgi:Malectin domain